MNKEPNCLRNPAYIDLFLRNSGKKFLLMCTITINLSDFHEPVVTALNETSHNERDWTLIKYLNVLLHNRTQSSCNTFFPNILQNVTNILF